MKTPNDSTEFMSGDVYTRLRYLPEPSVEAKFGQILPINDESIIGPPPVSSPPLHQETSEITKPLTSTPTVSRAPIRYNLPVPPSEIPASNAELMSALGIDELERETESDSHPRSLRPGQKGFAERFMSKYGWSKGSGLGASGSGIVNPLRVQVEKQRNKPDSEGRGFTGPGGRGKIVGGQKKGGSRSESQEGRFGTMSEIVVLNGMLDGMNLDAEMEASDQGGLVQEIGEECTEKVSLFSRLLLFRTKG